MADLLRVENLAVAFGPAHRQTMAVHGLSFGVQPGQSVALVGESGSGKSVTALAILRLVERGGGRIVGGRVRFQPPGAPALDLEVASEARMCAVRGRDIAMIFQEPMTSLNPIQTIGRQMAEVLTLHEGQGAAAARAAVLRMLDQVHMTDPARRLDQYPHELSGGMRQRVMIGMALLCRPRLLIADEPTTALDVTVQAQIIALIRELQRDLGTALLFISHDLALVSQIADEVVVMQRGTAVEQGARDALLQAPAHAYTQVLLAAAPRLGSGTPPDPLPRADGPVLRVTGLAKSFPSPRGPVAAVRDVSFEVQPGETLAIIGESGCGKSTTARLVMRLIEPSAGRIEICGQDVTTLDSRRMRAVRRNIQMVFQDPFASLNPRLAVRDLITEPLVIHRPELSREARRMRALALLRRVGLPDDSMERFPHQFSGGQRQRLCIARALSLNPRLIIADEAVSALDVSVQMQVLSLLRELQSDLGVAFLFISHDIGVVERISHRVAVMQAGHIVECGPTRQVLEAPAQPYTRQLIAAVPRIRFGRAIEAA